MYHIYIIKSVKTNKFYTGSTDDIEARLKRHNLGQNKSTKDGAPWILVYQESFTTRQDAYRREMQIKRYKGGLAFKNLL